MNKVLSPLPTVGERSHREQEAHSGQRHEQEFRPLLKHRDRQGVDPVYSSDASIHGQQPSEYW